MVKLGRTRRQGQVAVALGAVCLFTVVTPAFANHGDMPRIHWSSEDRQGIRVYNRAGSPSVEQAVADWNAVAEGLVSFRSVPATGVGQTDCAPPEVGAVVICRAPGDSVPAAVYANKGSHLGWCVVRLAWDDYPTVAHEMGHCLGLGHHGDGVHGPVGGWDGGVMGAEQKITTVDRDALRNVYSHSDQAPPPTVAPTVPAPSIPNRQPPAVPMSPPVTRPAPNAPPAAPAPGWAYSCAVVNHLSATGAELGGLTTDPGATDVTVALSSNQGVMARTAKYPYRVQFDGLTPGTAYTFTVTFAPGSHVASGAGCTFSTPAGPVPVPSPGTAQAQPTPAAPSPPSGLLPRTCVLICVGG